MTTESIDFGHLCRIIRDSQREKVLVTSHSVGDRDGTASAVAIASCFDRSVVATPDFLTRNTRRMLLNAGYTRKIAKGFDRSVDMVIVTDANNCNVLGELKGDLLSFSGRTIFIDHHAFSGQGMPRNASVFNDEGYNSASSIVYELLKLNREEITPQIAILLLNGIIADSADFQNASALTFRQVSELLGFSRVTYAEILGFFSQDVSAENRYNTIKDLSTAATEMVNGHILMHGRASSFANVAAETAIHLGADASVFWTEGRKEASISARLRAPLDSGCDINLGTAMGKAGELLGGNGGGHPCAAGAYGPSKERIGDAVAMVVQLLKERLSS